MKMIKWDILKKEVAFYAHVFRYVKIKSTSPTTGAVGDFDLVQCANWVNVIALTKDRKVILVRQYRHGTEEVTVEIPGGAINQGEEGLTAAQRELCEETGYTASKWRHLGRVDANPAFMSNYCDTYLALEAEKTHELELDPFEEIEVCLRDEQEIAQMIKSREITHSLVIAAFYFWEQRRLD